MTISMSKPQTTASWYKTSAALTTYINAYFFGQERDLVVYCFDHTEENWESLPAAWHRPSTGDVVLNLGVVFREMRSTLEFESGVVMKKLSDGSTMLVPDAKLIKQLDAAVAYKAVPEKAAFSKLKASSPLVDTFTGLSSRLAQYAKILDPYSAHEKVSFDLTSRIIGVLLHETGHAVFSDYIMRSWWQKRLSNYDRSILSIFDELRCEAYQIERVSGESGATRHNIRKAADLVVNPQTMASDLKKSKNADGSLSVSAVALNSTLVLGRVLYGVFHEDEVRALENVVESVVGETRYAEMQSIWRDYLDIRKPNYEAFKNIVERWQELFPEDTLKSSIAIVVSSTEEAMEGDEHSVIVPGGIDSMSKEQADARADEDLGKTPSSSTNYDLADEESSPDLEPSDSDSSGGSSRSSDSIDLPMLPSMFEEAAADAVEQSKVEKNRVSVMSSSASYGKAKKRVDPDCMKLVTIDDYHHAKRLAKTLQSIYLVGRDRFHVNTSLPPGRLRPRSAVQNAANRKQGNQIRGEQWSRVKLSTNVNPRLTVGIMTDCSGSQGWATTFSSRMAWILSRAFTEVNGRTAAVAFGSSVIITSKPGAMQTGSRVEIPAVQSSEQFDRGIGTLNHLLNLTNKSGGVRLLFVITDGFFVIKDETERCAMWMRELEAANCQVIWIHPSGSHVETRVPKTSNVHGMEVRQGEVSSNPKAAIDAVTEIITHALSEEKSKSAGR